MTALIFDTLAFSKKLKLSGFTDQQAEGQAEATAKLFETRIATKQDIKALTHDIKSLKIATKQDMKILKKEMLISIGGMIGGAVVVMPAIFKLISLI